MKKDENPVCRRCKHYDDRFNCKLANIRYGTGGYGPWWNGAACINDPGFKVPPNKFEAADDKDFASVQEGRNELAARLRTEERKVELLKQKIAAIAAGEERGSTREGSGG